jgi:hypothetical protein
MSENNDHDIDLEQVLKSMAPAPTKMDRDRLMFQAGQASHPALPLAWSVATGMLALTVLVLGALLLQRPLPEVVVRTEYLPAPVGQGVSAEQSAPAGHSQVPSVREESADEISAVAETGYLRLQDEVLRWGIENLPVVTPETGPDMRLPPIKVDRPIDSAASPCRSVISTVLEILH